MTTNSASAAAAAVGPVHPSALTIEISFAFQDRYQSAIYRGPNYNWVSRGILIVEENYPTMQHQSVLSRSDMVDSLANAVQTLDLAKPHTESSSQDIEWLDCGNSYLANISQGSEIWHQTRFCRLGMSKVGAALGLSRFETPEETLLDITGIDKKTFTEEQISNMSYGTQFEPEARNWYERVNSVTANEYGTFIPKFEPFLNYSSDGIVKTVSGMRCIEIKCPKKMYNPLKEYQKLKDKGLHPNISNYMWPTQYAQCQGALLLTGYEFIDFIVFCPNEEIVFAEVITFDEIFWRQHFWPLYRFLNDRLKPTVEKYGLKGKMIFPPVGEGSSLR